MPTSDTARTPPQDMTAEKHVLGLAIAHPQPPHPAGENFLKLRRIVKASDFYTLAHAALWQALETMHERGLPIELAAVAMDLKASGQIKLVGGDGTVEAGLDYLMELDEGYSFSTANMDYYAGIVRDKARLRAIIIASEQLVQSAFDPAADPADLLADGLESLRLAAPARLPRYTDAAEFLAESLPMADPIIEGLLRRGETATMVSASKARKSWTALELCVAVATGGEWFGLRCRRGRGLLIDCELQRATLQHRLKAVVHANGANPEDVRGRCALAAWRGWKVSLAGLGSYLGAIQPGTFDLIVVDPIYKLYPADFDENSNAAMAELFSNFQAFAERAQIALLLVCHSPKGDTSSRTVIDLVSGAGSAGRAVDVAIGLRPHEAGEPGAPVIVRETIGRSFADISPACFRWEHPRWIPAPELDPADLARPGRRKKKDPPPPGPSHNAEWLALTVLKDTPQTRDAILATAIAGGVPNINQAEKLLGQAEGGKLAYRWKLPKDRRTYFASVEQPVLLEGAEE